MHALGIAVGKAVTAVRSRSEIDRRATDDRDRLPAACQDPGKARGQRLLSAPPLTWITCAVMWPAVRMPASAVSARRRSVRRPGR